MTVTDDTLTVEIEREYPHPVDKLWRALTEPHLLADWLMQTDFVPELGRHFRFSAEWGGVDCEVTEIEPQRALAYRWGDGTLDTVVTWTLTPTGGGTLLRMQQTGFRRDQPARYYGGAKAGWPRMFDALGTVLDRDLDA